MADSLLDTVKQFDELINNALAFMDSIGEFASPREAGDALRLEADTFRSALLAWEQQQRDEQQDRVTVAAHRARCEAYEREHAGEIVELVREVSAMRAERDALRETLASRDRERTLLRAFVRRIATWPHVAVRHSQIANGLLAISFAPLTQADIDRTRELFPELLTPEEPSR